MGRLTQIETIIGGGQYGAGGSWGGGASGGN